MWIILIIVGVVGVSLIGGLGYYLYRKYKTPSTY
jgi:hypothetical protein